MPFEEPRCLTCRKCCIETEMILLPSDIERIKRFTNLDIDRFAIFKDGFYRLRNVDGRCIFLDDKGCKIYSMKPIGCSIYPLVFDYIHGPIMDSICPLAKEFMYRCKDVEEALNLLENFLKELEISYNYRVNWKVFHCGAKKLLNRCKMHSSKNIFVGAGGGI